MSILKSTRTGRCTIRVDLDYLKKHGWYYKKNVNGEDDTLKIWKDDTHCLQVLNFEFLEESSTLIMFHEEKDIWVYSIFVAFLDHLDDVEQFWKERDIDFEKAGKDFLVKYPEAKSYNAHKDVENKLQQSISTEINSRILDRFKIVDEYIKFNK